MKEIALTINSQKVQGKVGDTVLDVCHGNGIYVPTLCHMDGLTDVGGCRMCVVEIENERRPVPSCTYPAREGLVVQTNTPKLESYRRMILELLFTERNHFCMFCEKSGNCELQKLAYQYQMDNVRFNHRYPSLPTDSLSDSMVIDHNRCVLCGRCIRTCSEIVGNKTLDFGNRGWKTMVVADLSQPLDQSSCTLCGACVQACPTGAIFSKFSLYKDIPVGCQHVSTVCPSCGVGCQLDVLIKDNNIVRIDSTDLTSLKGPLCKKGRFGLLRERRRITSPLMRDKRGTLKECILDDAAQAVANHIARNKKNLGGMVSPRLPNEALTLFYNFIHRTVGSNWIDTTDGGTYRTISEGIRQFSGNGRGLEIECRIDEILNADCILLVEADPMETHPIVANAILRAKSRKGTKLIVIDSSMNPLPLQTDLWLKPKKGSEEFLITGLGRIHLLIDLLSLGKEDTVDFIQYMSHSEKNEIFWITGINVETLEQAAEMYGRAQKAVIIYGESLLKSGNARAVSSILKLATVTNNVCGESLNVISLKNGANSRGAWQMGLAAKPIDWEEVQSLYLFLGDDDVNEELLKKIRGLDLLIVQASYQSPITEMADIVLPSPTWAERVGTYISMDGQPFKSSYLLKRRDDIKGDTVVINTISQKLKQAQVKRRR